jgi:hypothetical protein
MPATEDMSSSMVSIWPYILRNRCTRIIFIHSIQVFAAHAPNFDLILYSVIISTVTMLYVMYRYTYDTICIYISKYIGST